MVRRAALRHAFIIICGAVVLPELAVAQSSDRTAVVRGIVYDSLIGAAPLAGAEIWIEGTNRTARTDPAGRFEIPALPAGRWRLNFSHPLLDSTGLSAPGALVDVTAGAAEVVLDVAQLLVQPFLGADEMRGRTAQQLASGRAALRPGMRRSRTGVPQIERHDVQLDRLDHTLIMQGRG